MSEKVSFEARKLMFEEKEKEKLKGEELKVIKTPTYLEQREDAIRLLQKDGYRGILRESDFWILKTYPKGYCCYTGLLIKHKGLVKINMLILPAEDKFDPKFVKEISTMNIDGKTTYVREYNDEKKIFETAEINSSNLKNDSYPITMLNNRLFDRVVKIKAGLFGIYSENEISEVDNDYTIDSETGEVQSTQQTKPSLQNKGLNIPKEDAIIEKPTINLSLNEALEHILVAGDFKGATMARIVNGDAEEDVKKMYLHSYFRDGVEMDSAAAKVILSAIQSGELQYTRLDK